MGCGALVTIRIPKRTRIRTHIHVNAISPQSYRAGERIAVWEKRPGARNEAWDLLVMTLILAESLQLNLENREPDYYSENVAPAGASTPKFGALNSGLMPVDPSLLIGYGVNPRPDVQHSGHDKPRWDVQNRPLEW